MMKARFLSIFAVLLLISTSLILTTDPADAGSTDPGYRDPPSADHIIHLTDNLQFTSKDPAYSLTWTINDTPGTDNGSAAGFLAFSLASAKQGADGYSYKVSSCLPSWITWDAYYGDKDHIVQGRSQFDLTIYPALQQVQENTVGDYWIWFECTVPSGIGKTAVDTYLIEFTVKVDWEGGVILPENYAAFILRLDYGLQGGTNNKTMRTITTLDAQEVRFSVKDLGIVREGYTFKGWSQTSGASVTDVGDEFPLNINMSNVRTTVDDSGSKTYEITLYAVWEPVPPEELDLPDFLRDLLDLLGDPAVLAVLFLMVFGTAYIVRMRRIGGY